VRKDIHRITLLRRERPVCGLSPAGATILTESQGPGLGGGHPQLEKPGKVKRKKFQGRTEGAKEKCFYKKIRGGGKRGNLTRPE